jgi:hypothetical protein
MMSHKPNPDSTVEEVVESQHRMTDAALAIMTLLNDLEDEEQKLVFGVLIEWAREKEILPEDGLDVKGGSP